MLTREQQHKNAIQFLNQIGSYKPYTNAFKNGTITMYEGFGGYYVEDEHLLKIIRDVEEQYDGTVYAVIHDFTNFGEMYTLLWSTGYEEDVDYSIEEDNGTYYAMSYVYNKTVPEFSEFGTVGIKPMFGGLVRVS